MNLTNFPESVDTFPNYLDILATDGALIAQYYQAIQQGDQAKATEILQQIPAYTQKRITATDLNKLMQAVLAVERFYKTNVEPYTEEMQIAWQEIIDQLDYKGTYSSGTAYRQNNIVSYTVGGLMQLYIATDDPPVGTPPTNTTYWRVFTIRGAKGDSGVGVSFSGEWSASQSYNIDNLVTYGNALWNALVANINQEPTEGSVYWQKIAEFPTVIYPIREEQPVGQQAGELWFHVTARR